jgi:hypothetical protein
MRGLLAQRLGTAIFDGRGWRDAGRGPGSAEGEFVDWLTIRDQLSSVVADVRRIPNHPLVPPDVPVYGYIYDVTTGRLTEVPEATETGRAGSTSRFFAMYNSQLGGTSSSVKIAVTGHSGTQAPQSMHSSGWMYSWSSPS